MKKFFVIAVCFLVLLMLNEAHAASRAHGIRAAGMRQVMLTIDDGPHGILVDEMLAILKEKDVKATFFLLGKDAEAFPADVAKIAAAGHTVANHAYSHTSLSKLSYEKALEELKKCNDIIEGITGERPRFMRPPHGEYNADTLRACRDAGLTVVFWKNNPGDYLGDPADVLIKKILKARRGGDIILLHLGLQNTIDALPAVIDSYKAAGFKFVTPDDISK